MTVLNFSIFAISANFNPHSHAGSDFVSSDHEEYGDDISIHTPTQGVTGRRKPQRWKVWNFNPHSHAGSDFPKLFVYNGTHNFNPHSHAGSDDLDNYIAKIADDISIHTPTQGVTNMPGVREDKGSKFQSTLPRREWHKFIYLSTMDLQFQSTLPRREWLAEIAKIEKLSTISIHTPTQGVTCTHSI